MRRLIALVCLTAACSSTKSTTEPPSSTAQTATQTSPQTAAQVLAPAAPKSGEELFGQICVTCHGKTGDGKGLEQQLFSFDTPAEQWKNGATREGVLKTLADGVHDSSMAAFPNYGAAEREAIAAYALQLRDELLSE